MSRLRRTAHSLASGYTAMGANVLYTLASVPLALHYLSEKEFALWALVTQVAGYLLLIDMGMSASVSRILIDYKDTKRDGGYGSVVKTGSLVLLVQGVCIALGGTAISYGLPPLLDIETGLASTFQMLVAGQCLVLGGFFAGRIFMHILQAHQRFDVLNYTQIVQMALGFGVQWLTFHWGWGIYSMLVAAAASSVCGVAINLAAVWRLQLLPPADGRGRASRAVFQQLFAFSNELFLLAIGLQLMNASQLMILTRTQGLTAAAVWAIATKTFQLAYQFVQRIFDFSGSALGEMIVRGEQATLRRRYREILLLTASLAVFVNVSVAVCNASFLPLWLPKWVTIRGAAHWPWWNDALLGLMMILNCTSRCQIGLAGYAKQVRTMRWIYFLEGATFVVAALLVAPHFGVPGIITVAIVANLAWSGAYGIRWGARYLGVSQTEMVADWLRPAGKYLLLMLPVTGAVWWATFNQPAALRLAVSASAMTVIGLTLLWLVGLSPALREELKAALIRLRPK